MRHRRSRPTARAPHGGDVGAIFSSGPAELLVRGQWPTTLRTARPATASDAEALPKPLRPIGGLDCVRSVDVEGVEAAQGRPPSLSTRALAPCCPCAQRYRGRRRSRGAWLRGACNVSLPAFRRSDVVGSLDVTEARRTRTQ